MRRKKEKRAYSQTAVNAVILVLILVVFVYLGVQISKNFSSSLSTLRTQSVTDSSYIYLKGYVFRDESPLVMEQKGIIDFHFRDGERVGVNQIYATYYPMPNETDVGIDSKQKSLDALNQSIQRFDGGVSGGMIADLSGVNSTLSASYYAYIDALLDGDYSVADKKGETVLDALVDYSIITGKGGASADIPKKLKASKDELIASFASEGRELVSNDGLYLYYTSDGYESIFSTDKLAKLTPTALKSLAQSAPAAQSSNTVGRVVHSPKWYMAMPTDEATALRFKEGSTYSVGYSGSSDKSVEMNLEKISVDENGEAYLLFSSFDLTVSADIMRAQNVKILMSSVTGYRIPSEAVDEIDGQKGVYILVGTVVEFRRITVIGEGNGYYIVNTYEKDLAEQPDNTLPYLNANDLIITSGNDLYDGKLLN